MATKKDTVDQARRYKLQKAINNLGPSKGQQQFSNAVGGAFNAIGETARAFGKTLYNNTAPIVAGAGYGVKEAIYKPFGLADSQLYARQNQTNINAARYAKPEQAQRLYNLVPNQLRANATEAQRLRTEAPRAFAKTSLSLIGAQAPAQLLGGMGLGGVINGGVNAFQGKSVAQGLGEGMAGAIPYAGINVLGIPFTNKLTGMATQQIAKMAPGVLKSGLAQRGIAGAVNAGENIAENYVSEPLFTGQLPTLEQNLLAGGAGMGFGMMGKPNVSLGKKGAKTIGQMQASVEQPLKQAFVKAQNSGNIKAMEQVVKSMEADPSYASVASVHRGMLERIKKNSPNILLAELNKAQESGDYLKATQLIDQIRGNRGSFMSAKAPGFIDPSAKVGGEAPKVDAGEARNLELSIKESKKTIGNLEKQLNGMAKNANGRKYLKDRIKAEKSYIDLFQRKLADLNVGLEQKPSTRLLSPLEVTGANDRIQTANQSANILSQPDPLEALKTEARKYKSAEELPINIKREIVRKMPIGSDVQSKIQEMGIPINKDGSITLYHGTSSENVKSIDKNGFNGMTWFDIKRGSMTDMYSKQGKGKVYEVKVDPSSLRVAGGKAYKNNFFVSQGQLKIDADGVYRLSGEDLRLRAKSQLTDLYTQATAPKGKITKVTTTKPQDFTFNVDGGKQRVQLVDTPQGKRLQIADTKLNVPLTSKQAVQVDSLINNSQAGQGLSRTSQKAIQPQTVDPQNGFSSQISDSTLNPGKITKAFQQQQGKTSQSVAQASKKADSPIQQLEDLRNIKGQQVRAKQVDLPSVDDIVRSQSNGVKNKVNALDYLRTPDKVLKKIGLGNEAELIKTQYGKYLDELPKEIDKVTSWYERVGKNEKASRRIFKYLDGQNQKLSGEELVVATEMKGYLKDWADRLGLPEDQRIANYITHIFEKDFIQKEFDPELAKIISDKVPGSVYDPFLQQRLGKLGYKEDAFSALDAYVKRATRKENMDVALEKLDSASSKLDLESWKYVKSYADRINLRPMDIDNLIDNAVKSSPIGYKLGQRPTASVSRGLRQMVYRGTLGLNVGSAIRNLTQGVNTYAKLGEKYTGIGYMKALRALASQSDELTQSGVMRNGFIEDRNLSATKKFWEKLDKGLFFMFEGAEKINRGSAYFGAKQKALDKGLSEAEAIKAGIEMARKTQFTFGSVDTPVALQSDLIKLATQFQSFNVKQTEFLAEMAKNKEYAGMLRWLGANMVVLATVGQAMGWDWKDMIPFGNVLDGQSPIGSSPVFQFGKDAATLATGGNDRYGNPMKPIQLANNAIPFVPGGVQLLNKTVPGLNDVNKGYATSGYGAEKLLDMATGNDRRVKFPIAQTPQNYITAGLLGTSKLPEARQYKNNEVSVLGEKQSETFRNLSQGDRAGYYEKILAKRDKNDTTSTTQDTQTTTTLPSDPESLKILYKDAQSTIKGYRANKVKSEAGLVEKDVEDYQAEVDKAIQLKKQIEQQYPDFRKDTKGIYTYEDAEGAEKTIDISKVTKMPSTSKVQQIKKKQETYSMVSTVMKSDLSEEKKQQAIQELGVSKKDADYYLLANEDNDVKIANAYDVMEKSQNFDDFMEYLVNGRRPVNGKILVTDGVINDLVDQGYLPESVGKELKDIDLYEDGTRNMGKIRSRNAKNSKARAKKEAALQRKDYEARMRAFNQFMNDISKIKTSNSSSGRKITKVNVKNLTFSGR